METSPAFPDGDRAPWDLQILLVLQMADPLLRVPFTQHLPQVTSGNRPPVYTQRQVLAPTAVCLWSICRTDIYKCLIFNDVYRGPPPESSLQVLPDKAASSKKFLQLSHRKINTQ